MRHGDRGGWDDRRGPGYGGRCGPGNGGRGGPGRRYFGRGSVKYALLELLSAEPMHGYQMMKALEEKSDGQYTPSAGSIYPTLQMLEDRGWIESDDTDGKKVYRPTEAGLNALREWLGRDRKERPQGDAECAVSSRERRLADGFELLHLLTKAERRAAVDTEFAVRVQRFLDGALQDLRSLAACERPDDRKARGGYGPDDRRRPDGEPFTKEEERES
ncbi:PadR family transcriptional regulator [Paenibacillus mesophilus]|uniref:PadR family transcriptional regulator n=1 Tax=Paenibacillus mesophilus TaxID=2582849 RepID=UPI00110EDE32|nr:PadR family transcriptional regulator [Paenibacillus mesophilus]TMV48084.1 PadR family transcriptional regulator [Paenibacillus mesophilus]